MKYRLVIQQILELAMKNMLSLKNENPVWKVDKNSIMVNKVCHDSLEGQVEMANIKLNNIRPIMVRVVAIIKLTCVKMQILILYWKTRLRKQEYLKACHLRENRWNLSNSNKILNMLNY